MPDLFTSTIDSSGNLYFQVFDGKSGADGPPNLGGRAAKIWIHDFVNDPSEPRFFDGKNQMPKFRGKLGDADLDALAALLGAERQK